MQKAKELALELQEDFEEQKPERTEMHMDGLKPAINNLLHVYLPDDITMKESETIAMVINEMVWNPYDFVRQEKKEAQL